MKKVSLFFGAGAEIGYGLPSGGKFALDVFKMDTTPDKKAFKENREKINKRSSYAKNWLPLDFEKKPISSFGRTQYETLVKSSLEYKRFEILNYLTSFDARASKLAARIEKQHSISVQGAFENILGISFGSETFTHEIKISSVLGEYNGLFGSAFFSSYLKALESSSVEVDQHLRRKCRDFCRAILELLIGACGEDLVHKLNDGIFEKKPDEIDIFDDLGSIFSLDYRGAGLTGLEMLLDGEDINLDPSITASQLIEQFAAEILQDIFSVSLDYQALIDSNWRYLYSPRTDWAKFCKISVFLNTTRRYIKTIADKHDADIVSANGFYHDVNHLKELVNVCAIGTTNYNNFIGRICNQDIYYLNGSVDDFYDPYLNSIVSSNDQQGDTHFTVPFLFTQSGIKPLTSIRMSERYVDLYNHLKSSDIVATVGYGFNVDDGHINGMFRSYIEDDEKNLTIFHYTDKFGEQSELQLREHYQEKLRLKNADRLKIVEIDNNRKVASGGEWFTALTDN